MARKQKAKGFNKFLDLIGLVNDDNEMDGEFDADFDTGRSKGRTGGRNINLSDEFADEPRMSRAQPRRERTQPNVSAANDRFDADEGWNTGVSSGRPQYGARTQQRAQSNSRPSGRYGSEQRYGAANAQTARATGKYDGAQTKESGYGRGTSYGGYRSGAQRSESASGYDAYGSSYYGGYEEETAAYGYGAAQEQQPAQNGYHRHQTIIFKLKSVDECKDVIKALIDKKSVLLNLDDLDTLQTQRTIDTMCGATYAIGAKLSRASDRTWLITPSTVEVADSQTEPGNGYGGRYI